MQNEDQVGGESQDNTEDFAGTAQTVDESADNGPDVDESSEDDTGEDSDVEQGDDDGEAGESDD